MLRDIEGMSLCKVCAHDAAVLHRAHLERHHACVRGVNLLILHSVFAALTLLPRGMVLGPFTSDFALRLL